MKHTIQRALKENPLKVVSVLIAPLVLFGAYRVIREARVNDIYAVDPLTVTYNGGAPPNPIFTITNMLPGDEVEKEFNIKNDSPDPVDVIMKGIKVAETQEFTDILQIIIGEVGGLDIFGGTTGFKTLGNFFSAGDIDLGNFPAGFDKNFRVKVKFPSSAGNEYQNALVVFDILWMTVQPPIELPPECGELEGIVTAQIDGTPGDDKISGTSASELIQGFEGNDKISGGGGHDCIIAGPGKDKVSGGTGNDIIVGGTEDDKLSGDTGNDKIFGGEGNDEISGGSGFDEIYGDEGDDKISGGSGDDTIHGDGGNDKISGGSGKDKLFGEEGNDKITGDSQNDFLDGGPDTDILNGNSGSDTCINGETVTSCEL